MEAILDLRDPCRPEGNFWPQIWILWPKKHKKRHLTRHQKLELRIFTPGPIFGRHLEFARSLLVVRDFWPHIRILRPKLHRNRCVTWHCEGVVTFAPRGGAYRPPFWLGGGAKKKPPSEWFSFQPGCFPGGVRYTFPLSDMGTFIFLIKFS